MPEAPRPFDPLSGNWLPPPDARPKWDPEWMKRGPATIVWHAVLGLDLAVLALLLALPLFLPATSGAPSSYSLAFAAIVNLALMGAIPFLWVVGTRVGGLHGAMHYLRLERPGRSIPWGILAGFGCLMAVMAVGLVLQSLHYDEANPKLDAIAKVMTLPLAALLAASAALGEEVLFRGVLQRWLGVWGQAALFGLAHLDYGTPLQVILPFALGLAFGYMVKRGARLWVPIVAHFVLDFTVLALRTIYAP